MTLLSWPGAAAESDEETKMESDPPVATQGEPTGPTYVCRECDIERPIGALDQDYAGRPLCPKCDARMDHT